ncbi:MAG: ABC transporter ATP-binding protein [Candidatus Gracilibacteria bacterium]|nr:ABC transporter ATP-binding protein [Candidatus Gracilibacteria bacterium]
MTYGQVLKTLILDFKKFIGNFKFYLIIVLSIIITISGSIEPFFASKAISYIENYLKNGNILINQIVNFFIIWVIYIISFYIIKFFYRFYLVDVNALKHYVKIENFYKDKVLNITQAKFLEKKGGSFFKIIDRGVEATFQIIFNVFTELIPQIVNIIGVSIVLFIINIKLALATISLLPVFLFLGYYFNVKTRRKQEKIHKMWNSFFGILGDFVNNLTLVKTLTFEKKASQKLQDLSNETLTLQIPISKNWGFADVYANLIMSLSRLIVILTGMYLIIKNELDFATLVLFFLFINFIYYPLSFIFANLRNLQRNLEAIKNMYEDFNEIPQDNDLKNAENIKNIYGKIEFKNVNFSYKHDDENEVLKNISFIINPGEKVALVGATGSGKSTITSLLLRFWEIKSGEILLDGINTKQITKSSLRKHIGIVMQDNSLFNTTIKENMLFAKPEATDEEITSAIKKAKAEFVLKQKDGINTEIGERGLKLSGGEKQRLNIARIILKNPEILVLDEATSALDNKTEIEIQKSLNELIIGKTSIIIAHRLSTIKKVDRIFVLDNGQIIESGTYEELLKKGGKFFELANPDKMVMS